MSTAEQKPLLSGNYDPGELKPRIGILRIGIRGRYMRSRLYTLMHEYAKIRSDLLIVVRVSNLTAPQDTFARSCHDYLKAAGDNLRSYRPKVYFCSSMLDLAASSLVWVYPDDIVTFRSKAVKKQLKSLRGDGIDDIKRPFKSLKKNGKVRCQQAVLADALEYFSQQEQRLLLADSLQVSRLRALLFHMGMALAFLVFAALFAVPVATTKSGIHVTGWPASHIGPALVTQLIAVAAVGAVGAAGGFFSGFVKTRDSSTTLDEYRTSMLKLRLRPLAGAVASIALYIFLGWQVTGVRVVNGGTFLLVGFLAGFSERYFLKLVQAPLEGSDQPNLQTQDKLASVRDQLVSIITGSSLPPSKGRQRSPSDNGSSASADSDSQPLTVPTAGNQVGQRQSAIKRQRSGASADWESLQSADGVSPHQPRG